MIEVKNSIIDANELMNRIRNNTLDKIEVKDDSELFQIEIEAGNLTKEIDNLYINIGKMNETWEITDFTIRSHRKILGPILVFAKRFVRKMLYWLIRPYWDKQIEFNSAATKAISDIARIQKEIIKSLQIDNGEE